MPSDSEQNEVERALERLHTLRHEAEIGPVKISDAKRELFAADLGSALTLLAKQRGEVEELRAGLSQALDQNGKLQGLLAAAEDQNTALQERIAGLEEGLKKIAKPKYGLGFNKLRGIAIKTLVKAWGQRQYDEWAGVARALTEKA